MFSEQANDMLKSNYDLGFLELPERHSEQQLHNGLVSHISRFMLELGQGFAFVGEKVELRMADGESFYPDLLFYHYKLKCFVVVELKVTEFKPEHAGKINFYVKAVDELMRGQDDNPTIGLLICRSQNKTVVEWALSDIHKPLGVASYELQRAIEASLNAYLDAHDPEVGVTKK